MKVTNTVLKQLTKSYNFTKNGERKRASFVKSSFKMIQLYLHYKVKWLPLAYSSYKTLQLD
ncbi:MAG: hypothetical protein FD167_4259 [bacterium]|nr:MAG: hypothetical protein FD167_4259 [bacterium]